MYEQRRRSGAVSSAPAHLPPRARFSYPPSVIQSQLAAHLPKDEGSEWPPLVEHALRAVADGMATEDKEKNQQ